MHDALASSLSAVPSTLLIPLAARAHGDTMFPQLAVQDTHAQALLARLGADVQDYLADRGTVYTVLERTRLLRSLATRFFAAHPHALGASLGCGLGHYFQWLDNGTNRWVDADLPEVITLRDPLLPGDGDRRRNAVVDLTQADWWLQLGLPEGPRGEPVLLLCEGVLMYLEPPQVQRFLHTFGQHAPPGSQLLLDAMCWLGVGRAQRNPSVRHTGAQFRWGLRHMDELSAAHPRLVLQSEHRVMQGDAWALTLFEPAFRWWCGVPLYAIVQMGVSNG